MRGEFMKTKDMLEDYLLSLEVSIKNKYTFLPKNSSISFLDLIPISFILFPCFPIMIFFNEPSEDH